MRKEQILTKIEKFKRCGQRFLPEPVCEEILSFYDIPTPPAQLARESGEAVELARQIGFPVVLKVISPQIIHKSDAGGVMVNLKSEEEVERAFRKILENAKSYNPKAEIEGIYVQKMAPPGREVIIGAVKDAQFGPVVMFGLGGIFVEVLKDVVFRVAPIDEEEAREMVDEIRGLPILKGVRGEKPIDFDSLSQAISNVSRLVVDFPQIEQFDANPVCVYPDRLYAVDARIILE
ncbi:acetyl-CoA synthetase [Candidatus Aerophobetes bacterium]|uniref:Acetyl-CoA synthetase n=1 Tax=Aerophobetes bacterium TaxID=2030807 RepID=A0A497E647_UNCAE|nr:MAG: acetyl-CoA synthetase [Candidatus Aerophobetes bacterium]